MAMEIDMLYNLIETRRGKETVVMTDALPKVRDRMKTLRTSGRKKVVYRMEQTDETIKYRKPPHDIVLAGGGRYPGQPRRVQTK